MSWYYGAPSLGRTTETVDGAGFRLTNGSLYPHYLRVTGYDAARGLLVVDAADTAGESLDDAGSEPLPLLLYLNVYTGTGKMMGATVLNGEWNEDAGEASWSEVNLPISQPLPQDYRLVATVVFAD